jgi:hypothetical protein
MEKRVYILGGPPPMPPARSKLPSTPISLLFRTVIPAGLDRGHGSYMLRLRLMTLSPRCSGLCCGQLPGTNRVKVRGLVSPRPTNQTTTSHSTVTHLTFTYRLLYMTHDPKCTGYVNTAISPCVMAPSARYYRCGGQATPHHTNRSHPMFTTAQLELLAKVATSSNVDSTLRTIALSLLGDK